MTLEEFNVYCASFPNAAHVVQWGGAHVWKIGGKVFAVAGWSRSDKPGITFKVSDASYELLKGQDGLRPAPYLASRGMKWIQRTSDDTMDEIALRDYLAESYRIVAAGLPAKRRSELGIG